MKKVETNSYILFHVIVIKVLNVKLLTSFQSLQHWSSRHLAWTNSKIHFAISCRRVPYFENEKAGLLVKKESAQLGSLLSKQQPTVVKGQLKQRAETERLRAYSSLNSSSILLIY